MLKQEIGFNQPQVSGSDWEYELRQSWHGYLVGTLGLSAQMASDRATKEITGEDAADLCAMLEKQGFCFEGKTILDIGCGHGTLAIQMALRGAQVYGLEPCEPWRVVAQMRASALSLSDRVSFIDGSAESLPFDNNTFDLVISLQVLEHVNSAKKVIQEISRILSTEGFAYISCENYLAFKEQHYQVFWLPLLPKALGAIYLKLLGRDPSFLKNHVRYVTTPQLLWMFQKSGMWIKGYPTSYLRLPFFVRYSLILLKERRKIFSVGFLYQFNRIPS